MTLLGLRPATRADIPAVVGLVTRAYRGAPGSGGWTTEADLLDGSRIDADLLAADLATERSEVLLAEHDGVVRACVHVAEYDDAGHLGMFAVEPALQGSGLGKDVMAAAERYLVDQWGASSIRLSVISVRSELIAFYERRGYRRTGETQPFPYGDIRFGEPKRDDLEFVVLAKHVG